MYRLQIDIPAGFDQDKAVEMSRILMSGIIEHLEGSSQDVREINWRLGNDEDRQKSNYLTKNENGHVSSKKSRYLYTEE